MDATNMVDDHTTEGLIVLCKHCQNTRDVSQMYNTEICYSCAFERIRQNEKIAAIMDSFLQTGTILTPEVKFPVPAHRTDKQIIPGLEFTIVMAIMQQSIFDHVDFDSKYAGFADAFDRTSHIEVLANRLIRSVGLEMVLKFFMTRFYASMLRNEITFVFEFIDKIKQLRNTYDDQTLGGALSLIRSLPSVKLSDEELDRATSIIGITRDELTTISHFLGPIDQWV